VDEGLLVVVADRVVLVPDRERLRESFKAPETQFGEERQEPPIPRKGSGVVVRRKTSHLWLEDLPCTEQIIPGSINDLSELAARGELVVLVSGAWKAPSVVDEARDQIARE